MAFWSSKPAPAVPAAADLKCSFCGLPQSQVRKLIAGPSSYICDRCVGLCNDIIVEDQSKRAIEPIALARESLLDALERASRHPLSVRRVIVEALLALAVGDAGACRQLARDAMQFGDPAGALLALASIPSASRTPEDAIHEASVHEALGEPGAALAVLEAIDASTASETTRAVLPLHRAHVRFAAGAVERDEAEQYSQMVAALRARWTSLVTSDVERRLLEREACLAEAHAARTLGHLVRAESIVREHLLSNDRDPLAWALLFEVHAEAGQVEHASAARKKALDLVDPGSRLAEKLRTRSAGPFR